MEKTKKGPENIERRRNGWNFKKDFTVTRLANWKNMRSPDNWNDCG